MKGRTLILFLLIIAISWGGNLWFNHSKQLEDPIFLKHFHSGAGMFELYYLTNRTDPATVVSIEFSNGELLHTEHSFQRHPDSDPAYGPQVRSRSTHYLLKTSRFDDQRMRELDVDHEGEATIHLSDGKTIIADIGKINFTGQRDVNSIFHSQMSSSSSNGRSFRAYTVETDIEVESMTSPFPKAQEDFKMKLYTPSIGTTGTPDGGGPMSNSKEMNQTWSKVAGAPLEDVQFPVEMKRGDRIRLTIQERLDTVHAYTYEMFLEGTTTSGEAVTESFLISNDPRFDPEQMERLIERRGSQ